LKLVLTVLMLSPTIWAMTDTYRRPSLSGRQKAGWMIGLMLGSLTPFVLLVPFTYMVAVVKKTNRHPDHGPMIGHRRRARAK
jgi:hypothetical protein